MSSVLLTLALAGLAAATPTPIRRQSITTLGQSDINGFTPYTWYASAGYCPANETINWSCGTNCDSNSGFKPIASGGDGDSVQFWYVGFDPSMNEIIVAHQGTDPSEFESLLTDGEFTLTNLNGNATLFPGIDDSIQVHRSISPTRPLTNQGLSMGIDAGLEKCTS
ncbi:hypothetical protein CONPUDRAFT_132138 [Coniophora puteana RWD-64-598 SS2]|uniref:Uncharacterized protein n=1 Tax=Coniophora puteana (strain RWD-64-598) TaxID=741705 RepID=A0A5M3M8D7_CONPW|nr:uncharacterized protein CONPUDRAFT_132138 [Coniophora puteana RWD-64-598 SS2]EIW75196.1 hypothetical protein CONPUDRAFT_132138 [Coniophora puteana RWD-64-598 SS2]